MEATIYYLDSVLCEDDNSTLEDAYRFGKEVFSYRYVSGEQDSVERIYPPESDGLRQ